MICVRCQSCLFLLSCRSEVVDPVQLGFAKHHIKTIVELPCDSRLTTPLCPLKIGLLMFSIRGDSSIDMLERVGSFSYLSCPAAPGAPQPSLTTTPYTRAFVPLHPDDVTIRPTDPASIGRSSRLVSRPTVGSAYWPLLHLSIVSWF